MPGEQGVKPVRAITWADAGDREAALVAQCIAGDDSACSRLVAEHQRMVYQLAFHLLADHNDALDLSQDVFLQVFRMLPRFRGQSTLKTWIYRIVVNQARNRQRWWRRRFRSAQVSLDQHVEQHGDLPATSTVERAGSGARAPRAGGPADDGAPGAAFRPALGAGPA